ncbi:MAG: hypothetical protein ACR2L3_04625 [Actinomycetota bacterium]
MAAVNLDRLLDHFERDLTDALRRADAERRACFTETDVLNSLLRDSLMRGSAKEYEFLASITPSIAAAIHRTVVSKAFVDPEHTLVGIRRNLASSGWINVPDTVAR